MSGYEELVHHLETVDGLTPSSSDNHLLVFFCSTNTNFRRFMSCIHFKIFSLGVKLVKNLQSDLFLCVILDNYFFHSKIIKAFLLVYGQSVYLLPSRVGRGRGRVFFLLFFHLFLSHSLPSFFSKIKTNKNLNLEREPLAFGAGPPCSGPSICTLTSLLGAEKHLFFPFFPTFL